MTAATAGRCAAACRYRRNGWKPTPRRNSPSRKPGRAPREQVSSMACRVSELVLGCRDPAVLARFWCEVLDFVVLDREDDGSVEIGPREGFGGPQPTIILSRRDEPEQGKSRLHIDVNATDRDQDAELDRLLKLGARPADIGQTGLESWHVLADPEGNEFCLLKARLNPL